MSESRDAGTDVAAVPEPDAPARYVVPIEALEAEAHVPLDDQVESQPASAADDSSWAWNEDERQLRLAGGM